MTWVQLKSRRKSRYNCRTQHREPWSCGGLKQKRVVSPPEACRRMRWRCCWAISEGECDKTKRRGDELFFSSPLVRPLNRFSNTACLSSWDERRPSSSTPFSTLSPPGVECTLSHLRTAVVISNDSNVGCRRSRSWLSEKATSTLSVSPDLLLERIWYNSMLTSFTPSLIWPWGL